MGELLADVERATGERLSAQAAAEGFVADRGGQHGERDQAHLGRARP